MKIVKISFLATVVASLVFIASCKNNDDDGPSARDARIDLLVTHSPWNLTTADVADGTATEDGDWDNFSVSFTTTTMTASNHATGASGVWPSGSWSLSSDLNTIVAGSREYTISSISSSSMQISFTVPEEVELGARTAALGGNYVFTFEGSNQ